MNRTSSLTLLLAAAACATARPPTELIEARDHLAQAEQGPAQQYKPDELHEAQRALEAAEKSFKEHGANEETKTLAYVAGRRARQADAAGATQQAIEQRQQAEAQRTEVAAAAVEKYKQEAAEALEAQKEALEKLSAAKLPVREERRGAVITLPGSVAFASNSATLLPSAQEQLNRVAEALKGQEDQRLVVEGYADSRGSDVVNQKLSQQRAEAVRGYLVARGLPSDRVTSIGMGEANPIATNATPEGRATNRRVEIVVSAAQPPTGTSPTGTGSGRDQE
jgi:outer membrane protein OmpA-like peptidoglycan-associated protein